MRLYRWWLGLPPSTRESIVAGAKSLGNAAWIILATIYGFAVQENKAAPALVFIAYVYAHLWTVTLAFIFGGVGARAGFTRGQNTVALPGGQAAVIVASQAAPSVPEAPHQMVAAQGSSPPSA